MECIAHKYWGIEDVLVSAAVAAAAVACCLKKYIAIHDVIQLEIKYCYSTGPETIIFNFGPAGFRSIHGVIQSIQVV